MDILNAFAQPFVIILPKLPATIINFLIGYLLIKITIYILKKAIRYFRLTRSVQGLVIACMNALLWAFLAVHLMDMLGLGNLIVFISGSAILLGFILNQGLAQAISDIASSISLAHDRDFKIGTTVEVNDGKTTGEIVSLDMRKVKIIDKEGRVHVVPNSIIDKGEWVLLERPTKKHESSKSKK